MQTMQKIPVLLIEDNRLLRGRIASMLNHHGDFEVIEGYENREAIRKLKIRRPPPHVVLMNPWFEEGEGVKMMALLREELPEAKSILMDIMPDRTDVVGFVKAGVSGFILRNALEVDYIKTIKTVAEGYNVLPPILTGSLFTQIVESVFKSGAETQDNFIKLTNREREIADLIARGMSNKEIAESLHIATYTVKSHVHKILEKLEIGTRLQIAVFARKANNGWPVMQPLSPSDAGGIENTIGVKTAAVR